MEEKDKKPDVDGRIKSLEMTVGRLMRRSKKFARAYITPFPISHGAIGDDVRGDVLRYMFPCNGKIKTLVTRFGSRPAEGTEVTLSASGVNGGYSSSYISFKQFQISDVGMEILAGDKLVVSLDGPREITEFWVAFLWVPATGDTEVKKFLFDELERDIPEE